MDVDVRYNVNVTENDLCKFIVEVFDKPVKLDRLREQGFTPEESVFKSVSIIKHTYTLILSQTDSIFVINDHYMVLLLLCTMSFSVRYAFCIWSAFIVMSVDIVRRLIPIRSRKFPTNIAFRTWLLEFGDCPTTAPGDIPSDNRQANEWSVWKSASGEL